MHTQDFKATHLSTEAHLFLDFLWISIRSKRWRSTPAAGVEVDKSQYNTVAL